MKNLIFVGSILGLALAASAQTNGKVGIINMQAAIAGTKDGQKAAAELQQRFGPKKTDLDKRDAEIAQLQQQLQKATTDDDRARLTRDIDQKTKSLNRDREDARADLDQAEQKFVNEIGGRMVAITEKYAQDHGYTWIVDVSTQQTPVVYFSDSIDITKEIIGVYDSSSGSAAPAAKPAVPGPKPATPTK